MNYPIDELLTKVKRIHFIGIGGAGMCPLAEILHAKGYLLSGSDNNESDTLNRIRALGIPVVLGQKAENIGDAEMVVYTAALLPDNPELVAAKASGVPTFERSKLFGAVTRKFGNCIGVCGTHGKTTTTSMLTQMLLGSDIDTSAVIGGRLPLIGANGRTGTADLLVCEACEFANTFLDLSPSVALLLNIDADHLEFFKTMDNLVAAFSKFAGMARDCVIYNGDDEKSVRAVETSGNSNRITFGFSDKNDWYPENISYYRGAFPAFDVMHKGEKIGRVQLGVPGRHNILNALGAIAAAVHAGADTEKALTALAAFKGAGRRFEILDEFNGITIADDYAHHPAELKVTLEAAKKMDYKRVWAVFQPFTFSRTYMLLDDFADVLKIADKVVLTEIMGSREVNTYDIHTAQLAEKIEGSVWFRTFDTIAQYLYENLEPGDLVITLGCGDVYKIAKKLIKKYHGE
ncbi:MAG: UDP-N-acetylmuramate--L-alanine ligase [Clostridia bacterium]|nr:UDP-N-acetylmuramate--L-alanine ligase [Clostridia bacterium]MBR0537132.1 UDP-N-acetylmuramate--L-alanine ligase [Clostridia bacterium]